MRGAAKGPLDVSTYAAPHHLYEGSQRYDHHQQPAGYPEALKTRSPSPASSATTVQLQSSPDGGGGGGGGAAATGGGGGFWLASVTGTPLPATAAAAMEAATESGFISSQPSMAEFMMAEGAMQHSPGGSSMSPGAHHPGYHGMMDPLAVGQDASGINVPEYPWMKEKKTTRKSSQQGNV